MRQRGSAKAGGRHGAPRCGVLRTCQATSGERSGLPDQVSPEDPRLIYTQSSLVGTPRASRTKGVRGQASDTARQPETETLQEGVAIVTGVPITGASVAARGHPTEGDQIAGPHVQVMDRVGCHRGHVATLSPGSDTHLIPYGIGSRSATRTTGIVRVLIDHLAGAVSGGTRAGSPRATGLVRGSGPAGGTGTDVRLRFPHPTRCRDRVGSG